VTLGLKDVNSNNVPGLQRSPFPAEQTNRRRAAYFCRPMLEVTIVIFIVEVNEGVGVNLTVFRDNGALHHHRLARVVRRSAVMRERSTANG